VYTVRPEHGLAFVSVSWGGMAGAVTGLNEAGLWVSINSAATDGQAFVGRPIVMVVRELLQNCRTIDAALAIIERAPVFVSDGILLASGTEDRVVVAEKGPRGMGVRTMENDALVLTNHFLSQPWQTDKNNAERMRAGTTMKRAARAEQLLAERASHDADSIMSLLRDRRGDRGADIGFGNRSAINAWIGAHAVVADVQAGIIWVAEPFHGLGVARAFTVHGPAAVEPLPESGDRTWHDQVGDDYVRSEKAVVSFLARGDIAQARPLAERLLALNPNSFQAHVLLAQCSRNPTEKRALLRQALQLQPAYLSDGEAINKALDELEPTELAR
jgi:Acyl-coenzyme A:6-aminopenicillanic acid acyl-transferase